MHAVRRRCCGKDPLTWLGRSSGFCLDFRQPMSISYVYANRESFPRIHRTRFGDKDEA